MKTPKKRSARIWIVAGLLFAPILYVLSIGPVARWASSQEDPDAISSTFMVVYAPVSLLMDAPVVGPLLDLYCELWIDPESVWAQVHEFAASEPALQFLGVPKNVGVGRVFVGGSPPMRMGIDFDLNVDGSVDPEATIQLASFDTAGTTSKARCELRLSRPPAGPEESIESAVLLANADDYTEYLEERKVSGTPAVLSGRVFELRGNVRFRTPDESLEIECDRATVEFAFEKGSTTAIRQISLLLVDNVRWTSAGFKATAPVLRLGIGRPASEGSPELPITGVEFLESPRFSTETASGQAVEMSFEFDPTEERSFGIPARIRLGGNAVVEIAREPGVAPERVAADRLIFLPRANEIEAK